VNDFVCGILTADDCGRVNASVEWKRVSRLMATVVAMPVRLRCAVLVEHATVLVEHATVDRGRLLLLGGAMMFGEEMLSSL